MKWQINLKSTHRIRECKKKKWEQWIKILTKKDRENEPRQETVEHCKIFKEK